MRLASSCRSGRPSFPCSLIDASAAEVEEAPLLLPLLFLLPRLLLGLRSGLRRASRRRRLLDHRGGAAQRLLHLAVAQVAAELVDPPRRAERLDELGRRAARLARHLLDGPEELGLAHLDLV